MVLVSIVLFVLIKSFLILSLLIGVYSMKKIQIVVISALMFCVSVGSTTFAFAERAAIEKPKAIELFPEDFKPAFTREVVTKLNAIVRRSYNSINEYDTNSQQIDNAKELSEQQLAKINKLAENSQSALRDMIAAVKELEASGEHYNAAILAGMMDFVTGVEKEITAQQSRLANKL